MKLGHVIVKTSIIAGLILFWATVIHFLVH